MFDWLNFRLGEIIGLIHALEKRYYKNKTQLRYKFGSVYIKQAQIKICYRAISHEWYMAGKNKNDHN